MTHQEFVAAFHDGSLRVQMPPKVAAAYLSQRLLLPFFMLPVLGAGVALALIGWLITGALVFLAGFVAPRIIKHHAARILIHQALLDEGVYRDLLNAGVLQVEQPS